MHAGEPAHEKGRDGRDDMVLGLEPGEMQQFGIWGERAVVGQQLRLRCIYTSRVHRSKPHEGGHLVHVAPHHPGHAVGFHAVGVQRIVAQARLMQQAPQQSVEQGESPGIAVQHNPAAQLEVVGRHPRSRGRRRGRAGCADCVGCVCSRGNGRRIIGSVGRRCRIVRPGGRRRHIQLVPGSRFGCIYREKIIFTIVFTRHQPPDARGCYAFGEQRPRFAPKFRQIGGRLQKDRVERWVVAQPHFINEICRQRNLL